MRCLRQSIPPTLMAGSNLTRSTQPDLGARAMEEGQAGPVPFIPPSEGAKAESDEPHILSEEVRATERCNVVS